MISRHSSDSNAATSRADEDPPPSEHSAPTCNSVNGTHEAAVNLSAVNCPDCQSAAAIALPLETLVRLCNDHLAARRQAMCRARDADPAHQRTAGIARGAGRTRADQSAAGHASQTAFSARWRAEQGLAPLSTAAVRRYLTPDLIKFLGQPLPMTVQQQIYDAWCAGDPRHVDDWVKSDPR